jgi:hypothetical protein
MHFSQDQNSVNFLLNPIITPISTATAQPSVAVMTTNELLSSNSLSNNNNNNISGNLDDRSSLTSGVAGCGGLAMGSSAWRTTATATSDTINNISGADSDFECNSPSKYTPYSTFSSSSYCSNSAVAMMLLPLDQGLLTHSLSNNINQSDNNATSANASALSIVINNLLTFFNHTVVDI